MLHITKNEMRSDADRNAFGLAALAVCKAAKNTNGVNDAKFFWINPNLIGIIVDAEAGAWGADVDPSADAMKAFLILLTYLIKLLVKSGCLLESAKKDLIWPNKKGCLLYTSPSPRD